MTADLNTRWLAGLTPFDGITLSLGTGDLVPLPFLRRALRGLVERLQQRFPDEDLYTAEDWHEHDGYVSEARRTTWDGVRSWLASEEALYAAGSDDTYVWIALFPEGLAFYLRFYIPRDAESEDPERRGDFDLTCSRALVGELAVIAAAAEGLALAQEPAKAYFDRHSGG
jgi:hypothetical protein